MCGTSAKATRPYSTTRARVARDARPRPRLWAGLGRRAGRRGAGPVGQLTRVSSADSAARPYQQAARPVRRSSGTSVPEAAMPRPTPAKMAPPTRPRRAGPTWGRIVEAASTMMSAPATPDARRQARNHAKESGTEQARHDRVTADHGGAEQRDGAEPRRERAGGQRAGQVAGEVGGAEVDDVGGREPPRVDQRGDQGRVGEAGEAEADRARRTGPRRPSARLGGGAAVAGSAAVGTRRRSGHASPRDAPGVGPALTG